MTTFRPFTVPAGADPYDRTWHAAFADGSQIARYDRTAKYYVERPDGTRRPVKISEAVALVVEGHGKRGSTIAYGRAGGTLFDAAVRKALANLGKASNA